MVIKKMHEKTFSQLRKWYKRSFQMAGWIVIGCAYKDQEHEDHKNRFLDDLTRLSEHLNERKRAISSESPDLKEELSIMDNNVQKMHRIIKNSPFTIQSLVNYKKHEENESENMTFYSISKHYEKIFKMVGWALLSYHKGNKHKIHCMFDSASHLHAAILKNRSVNKDTKEDLRIMKEHIERLLSVVLVKATPQSPSPTRRSPSQPRRSSPSQSSQSSSRELRASPRRTAKKGNYKAF